MFPIKSLGLPVSCTGDNSLVMGLTKNSNTYIIQPENNNILYKCEMKYTFRFELSVLPALQKRKDCRRQ